jgi:hypothetical protein
MIVVKTKIFSSLFNVVITTVDDRVGECVKSVYWCQVPTHTFHTLSNAVVNGCDDDIKEAGKDFCFDHNHSLNLIEPLSLQPTNDSL